MNYYVYELVNPFEHIFHYVFSYTEIKFSEYDEFKNYDWKFLLMVPEENVSVFIDTWRMLKGHSSPYGPQFYKVDDAYELEEMIKYDF